MIGDAAATDPACALSPDHHLMAEAVADSLGAADNLIYRRIRAPGLVE